MPTIQITNEQVDGALRSLLKTKQPTWGDEQVATFLKKAGGIGKPLWEVICVTQHIATHRELAEAFSAATAIPFAEDIEGEIIEISPSRYCETMLDGERRFYLWHPRVANTLPTRTDARVQVFLVCRDLLLNLSHNVTPEAVPEAGEEIENVTIDTKEFLLNVLKDAVQRGATDVHLYPIIAHDVYRVKFRILGDLVEIDTLPIAAGRLLLNAIRTWAKQYTPSIKIDEARRPQDGRIEVKKEDIGTELDVRISIIWKYNMKDADVVMRLLYMTELKNGESSLQELGFLQGHVDMLQLAISRRRGIILVTGATGTGKSKTVNTLLSMLPPERNVLTIEDPVEYHLTDGRQFQVMEWGEGRADAPVVHKTSFSDFARAFKRHDPDVIFIGELRDKETVRIAFELGKTGHLVFGTLHAARGTMIPEILVHDYGIDKHVVADNLLLGSNQVLVKKLCPRCKKRDTLENMPDWINHLRFPNLKDVDRLAHKGLCFADRANNKPCFCLMKTHDGRVVSRGYKGRTLLSEVFEFRPEHFSEGISAFEMEEKLVVGAHNILNDAVEKVLAGTLEVDAIKDLL